jgi:hypothetical protein
VVRNTRASSIGARSLRRSARASAGSLATLPKMEYASISFIWAAAASAISWRPWPTLAYQRLALASR